MKTKKYTSPASQGARHAFLLLLLFAVSLSGNSSPSDTTKTKKIKTPKHYFLNTVFYNYYAIPKRTLNQNKTVGKILKDYRFWQSNSGFYLPLYTKDIYKDDSTRIANWHFLATGNFLTASPVFGGLSTQHVFYKYSLGLRAMYNNGKRSVFFLDISPFATSDKADTAGPQFRSASTFVWSYIAHEKFSFRVGYTRTFIFGDRLTLPYLGVRFGKLDKHYVSIQFPRNIFVNFRMSRSLAFNMVAKPVGGVYNFRDLDSLYSGTNKQLFFGRRDICFGLGLDYHPSKFFSLFVHAGTARGSGIVFYSKTINEDNNLSPLKWFYYENLKKTGFINFGLTVRFGKSKSAYGNKNIYELQSLNAEIDPGDNNTGPNSSEINSHGDLQKLNKLKYKDLSDLIDSADLYD
jgi:hypothetical protein